MKWHTGKCVVFVVIRLMIKELQKRGGKPQVMNQILNVNCFGARAEGRSGDICPSCKKTVAISYRNNRDLSYADLLDSKQQQIEKQP